MKRNLVEIYALAVCFFTLSCFVIAFGMAIWDVVELAAPEFTISSRQYECHQSDEAYKNCYSDKYQYTKKENPDIFPQGEALTKKRTSDYRSILKSKQRQATQGLVQKTIIIIIDLIAFAIHWKLAARIRRENS